MLGLIRLFLGSLVVLFRPRAALVAENLALRHQLGILLRSRPARVPLTSWDRALWAFVLHRFPSWRQSLVIVRPETVIAWHRQAFRRFWRRKSQAGRPRAHAEVCRGAMGIAIPAGARRPAPRSLRCLRACTGRPWLLPGNPPFRQLFEPVAATTAPRRGARRGKVNPDSLRQAP